MDIKKLAQSEIDWWEAYHTRSWSKLEEAIKELRKEQFGVEISDEAAMKFANATSCYINYKEYYAKGDREAAQRQLRQAELYMQEHYEDIMRKIKELKKK